MPFIQATQDEWIEHCRANAPTYHSSCGDQVVFSRRVDNQRMIAMLVYPNLKQTYYFIVKEAANA